MRTQGEDSCDNKVKVAITGWCTLYWQDLWFLTWVCSLAVWPFYIGLLLMKYKGLLDSKAKIPWLSSKEAYVFMNIFSLRREIICVTDSGIFRRQWGYQITKTWTYSPLTLKFVPFVPPTYVPEMSHDTELLKYQTFMCTSSASLFWLIHLPGQIL